jgi:membrane protein YdbS with pleckstrin-like domain
VIPAENTPAKKLVRRKSMGTILIIILVLLLVGALPTWPYSGGWGYYPSGGLGLVLLIVIVLALTGRV